MRLIAYDRDRFTYEREPDFHLPVVGETYDGWLSDINGFHVTKEHLYAAADAARTGPVTEGCVGGGTGMNLHEFKGGIGTSSRRIAEEHGGWTVGVLVQANYGMRHTLRIDGVPIGTEIGFDEVPSHTQEKPKEGSIIIILATDAPLLPDQCRRIARRATIGLARVGGNGNNGSGDLFLAFSTANRGMFAGDTYAPFGVQSLQPDAMSPLFEADGRCHRRSDRQRPLHGHDSDRRQRPHVARGAARPGPRVDGEVQPFGIVKEAWQSSGHCAAGTMSCREIDPYWFK